VVWQIPGKPVFSKGFIFPGELCQNKWQHGAWITVTMKSADNNNPTKTEATSPASHKSSE
jgi:hypothetical protein